MTKGLSKNREEGMSAENIFKLMIIDDNISIHHDFIKILKTESSNKLDQLSAELFGTEANASLPRFEIDVATQGKEGVEKIKQALDLGVHYALAFVDIRMPPGWDGIETIKHIWKLDKDIQIVICTAYSDYSWEETIANLGKTDNLLILKKPFDNISVRQLACALTTKWHLAQKTRNYTANLQKQIADKTLSLQESLSLVKSTFESSSNGILVINNGELIIDYNHKMISLMNIPEEILKTKSKKIFLDYLKNKIVNFDDVIKICESGKANDENRVDTIRFRNGKIFECYSQPHELNGEIIGRILDFRDITKRAKLEEELEYQAKHDTLTGLGNRLKLIEQMKAAINVAQQQKSQFAIVFIDFDRFKLINDSLTHLIGDELLKNAAGRLQSAIRSEDTLCRLGGDEFVIILMNIDKKKDIEKKVNNLMELFSLPFELNDRKITLTASMGVSVFPNDGETVDILLRNADVAMYQAKAIKGNNFKFYHTDMSVKTLAEFDQEADLRQAIANEEFFLCYQPQIHLSSEKIVALEALIRWQHPKKGVLLPIDFIPLAEEIGLIVPIGEWVLRSACKQNKAWQAAGFSPVRVAVNISAQQFKQQNLVDMIQHILQETGLSPEYLELELTENVILSNREVIEVVSKLKKLGIMIAIDDFGTGYSSLSYLNELPLDRLKIDSSFIKHINSTTDDEVIIRAVIAMAKNLNLEVLVEGVETKNQLTFLRKNECGDVQGFYFSKPLSSGEIEDYLRHPEKQANLTHIVTENEE